jgi:hypothetical protein
MVEWNQSKVALSRRMSFAGKKAFLSGTDKSRFCRINRGDATEPYGNGDRQTQSLYQYGWHLACKVTTSRSYATVENRKGRIPIFPVMGTVKLMNLRPAAFPLAVISMGQSENLFHFEMVFCLHFDKISPLPCPPFRVFRLT